MERMEGVRLILFDELAAGPIKTLKDLDTARYVPSPRFKPVAPFYSLHFILGRNTGGYQSGPIKTEGKRCKLEGEQQVNNAEACCSKISYLTINPR